MPSEAMINAAHQAVWFDAEWAINSRRDFRSAVRAMIIHAIGEGKGRGGTGGPDCHNAALCGIGMHQTSAERPRLC